MVGRVRCRRGRNDADRMWWRARRSAQGYWWNGYRTSGGEAGVVAVAGGDRSARAAGGREIGHLRQHACPRLAVALEPRQVARRLYQPYDQTEGKNVHLRNYVASGPIPDQVWPQARQRAQELAAGLGATGGQGFKDQPGDHDARFYSPEGTVLWLASTVNAAISSGTGCRLPAAKKNAPPASTPPTS